ncbi:hypothetical protein PVK06_017393 [Gossypium arboreum]|uniref:Uncharacterized protein n=1 Tax=Gossypium arboreum TaxID=29729 RepID=A0ABR0Q2Z2_GOSAR|nr:hypothetical protein PVK06_017393 [Gossypium arboreum]
MPFYKKTKYEEGEEEYEDEDIDDEEEKGEEPAHDYNLNDMFQSEQPTIRRVKLHNLGQTSLNQSAGRRATKITVGRGKSKAIQGRSIGIQL